MLPVLMSKKNNCRNCYKCIRYCPVKSIRFSDNQASIMEEDCVLCGQCYNICPQGAKEIRNDTERAKAMLKEGECVVSVAPSFAAYYPGFGIASLERALQELGFRAAEETAAGAALVAKEYDALMRQQEDRVLISSCCPSVNQLIQKYYPEALPYLAHVKTPMQAHGALLKERYPGASVVFIGPCIAKKEEAAHRGSAVDLVLTFEELDQWLQEQQVGLQAVSEPQEQGGRSRLFPTTGGILKTMARDANCVYLAVDGMENCKAAIRDLAEGKLAGCFIEMSACAGSCIGGPVMTAQKRHTLVHGAVAVSRYAKEREFPVAAGAQSLACEHPYLGRNARHPGNEAIEEILHQMGKYRPEDELNCGSCGYDTCREKALAVFQGKANYAMCLPFLKEKAESFSDNIINNTPNSIIVLNEAMEVQQINRAAMQLMGIAHAAHVLGEPVVRILDPVPFVEVLDSGKGMKENKAYLAEYGKYVERNILYDRDYHLLICIMRDITKEETAREKREAISRSTIETTDQVIQKQMRVAQEIASLLGETTAETKVALTKLKETFADEQ